MSRRRGIGVWLLLKAGVVEEVEEGRVEEEEVERVVGQGMEVEGWRVRWLVRLPQGRVRFRILVSSSSSVFFPFLPFFVCGCMGFCGWGGGIVGVVGMMPERW